MAMRYLLVLAALTLPITAGAQGRSREHRPAAATATGTAPRAGAASARAAGPQRLHAPSDRPRTSLDRSRATSDWPRWQQRGGHSNWRRHGFPPLVGGSYYARPYFGYASPYGYYAMEASPYEAGAEAASMRTTGILRLDITPATQLNYYIDGMYIGSSADLGTEFAVNAGARRIEVRAPDYKPVIFDARFEPGGTVTRRGALEPLQDESTLPRATGSRTMYVIPGCFIGNARPDPGALPKGCDINRLVTRGGS